MIRCVLLIKERTVCVIQLDPFCGIVLKPNTELLPHGSERSMAMAKRCQITGKGVMTGNNVSHAKNRTRRRFLPNLQQTSMQSEILGRTVSLRVTTSAIRTIEKHGGLDAFLMQARNAELADDARALKREMLAASA